MQETIFSQVHGNASQYLQMAYNIGYIGPYGQMAQGTFPLQ